MKNLDAICNSCTNQSPQKTLDLSQLEYDCPVYLSPLAEETRVFHMPTTATQKCISEEAAKGLLTPFDNKLLHIATYIQSTGVSRRTDPNETQKRAILLKKIGIRKRDCQYFSYKCPLTRESFVVKIHAKYTLTAKKITIIEGTAMKNETTDEFLLEYAVMRLISPWFGAMSVINNDAFTKYNPAAWAAKSVLLIGKKTGLYKSLRVVVIICDITQRLFMILGANYLCYKLIHTDKINDFRLKESCFALLQASSFWFAYEGLSSKELVAPVMLALGLLCTNVSIAAYVGTKTLVLGIQSVYLYTKEFFRERSQRAATS